MSLPSDCPACAGGDHRQHNAGHGLREGLIGGTYCACGGDCAERKAAILRALADALATPSDPSEAWRS